METASSIVFAAIAPHPPIMVPEVGHEAIAEVRGSIEAMAELTHRLLESGAETLILISPHAPLDPEAFVAYRGPRLEGDFANFRAPEAVVEATLDEELLQSIVVEAGAEGYEVVGLRSQMLDHGTAVPLYFLQRNGWQGQVVSLGYTFLSNEDHLSFGACVKRAADRVGKPVAFVASGDLSHRLKPEAPAGYSPDAHLFDEEVVAALHANAPDRIINIDQDLRKLAGECGYRSLLVALGATRDAPRSCEVLNYEAPFGVGYLVAQIAREEPSVSDSTIAEQAISAQDSAGRELPALARQAIETLVLKGERIKPPASESGLLSTRAACFVSIKTSDGELRGCIGTIEPTCDTLAEELVANAINSATRDPRFPPLHADELPGLCYSVDVLSPPEPATFEDLDPEEYGVIVEDESGLRRGLLLPDIAGVDTASRQVDIAARKAGILSDTPIRLSRFRVQRFRED